MKMKINTIGTLIEITNIDMLKKKMMMMMAMMISMREAVRVFSVGRGQKLLLLPY